MTPRSPWYGVALLLLGAVLWGGGFGCAGGGERRARPEVLVVPAGTTSPSLGLAFDLSYDPRTDQIIPGYRILQVGISNRSLNVLQLDPLKDRWAVVDRRGRRRPAVIDLRRVDPDTWGELPQRLRRLIQYPLIVNLSRTLPIDLLIPDHYALNEFRGVIFESATLGKIVQIYAREEGTSPAL